MWKYYIKDYAHPLGHLQQDSQRLQFYQHQKNAHSSMHTLASKNTNGMIGHLFIFKKWTTEENRLKITTPQKYLVSCLLKENVKLGYSELWNHFFGVQWNDLFLIWNCDWISLFHLLWYQYRLLYTHYVWFQIAVVTETSILLFYQNVIGADSLGKELSSLTMLKFCVRLWENRNIRVHQQCTIASDWVFG